MNDNPIIANIQSTFNLSICSKSWRKYYICFFYPIKKYIFYLDVFNTPLKMSVNSKCETLANEDSSLSQSNPSSKAVVTQSWNASLCSKGTRHFLKWISPVNAKGHSLNFYIHSGNKYTRCFL